MSTEASTAVFGPGSISLRLYPHDAPPADVVRILARQAAVAVDNGFDGVVISEGHGVRTNVPNPLQVAGWLLEEMATGWAAPCPLLLPLLFAGAATIRRVLVPGRMAAVSGLLSSRVHRRSSRAVVV